MKQDLEISELIKREENRQSRGVELIASENFVSDQVLAALGSVCTNKYAEGYPGHRYYGGCQEVDKIEQVAIDRICKLFDAEYANVQPHSGAQANMAVMMACINPGDTFMGLNLDMGGHLTHGSPVNVSGKMYHAVAYGLNKETGLIDYDDMEKKALENKPKLIIGGASAYSREWDWERMRAIADKVGAILWVDMAHPAGLIAKGLLKNPVKYAHIVTSTTHKTLRGPRGGIILVGKDFENPWGQKTPKGEIKKMRALQPEFKTYVEQVHKNAVVMADEFMARGYKVVSGGTDNHMMLIDLRTKFPDLTGKVVENTLVQADITVNKNMVPFDTRSPFQTSGIRVGTPAVTTRGLKENDIKHIVELIDKVLNNITDEKVLEDVRHQVEQLMVGRPLNIW